MTEKDEPRIADATGSAHIYIWHVKVPAGVGEMISANGFVDDDPGPLEIYARHAARGHGTCEEAVQDYSERFVIRGGPAGAM